jgi:hypothetical protein
MMGFLRCVLVSIKWRERVSLRREQRRGRAEVNNSDVLFTQIPTLHLVPEVYIHEVSVQANTPGLCDTVGRQKFRISNADISAKNQPDT